MEKEELISVIIPCYNAEKYLNDCLNSLLNQTYKKLQVIIVNDGSTDDSENIINKYIKLFNETNYKKLIKLNQENKGQAAAINYALKYVKGKYLLWQDADDYYEIDAIEKLHHYLVNNDVEFVRGEVAYRNENDMDVIVGVGKSKYPYSTSIFNYYVFEKDSYCFPGIFMVKMDFFDKCIENRHIYESRAGQNWQLILPLAYNGKCGYLNDIVYNYRIVKSSHFHSVVKKKDLIERCNSHQDLLINIINNIDQISYNDRNMYIKKIKLKYFIKKIKIIIKWW